MKLTYGQYWQGEYRGLDFKICHWGVGKSDYRPQGTWNYYLFIPLAMIPEKFQPEFLANYRVDKKGRICYDYSNLQLLNNLDWHCRLTYYEKHGLDGAHLVIEVGCGYGHFSDEGQDYRIEKIQSDCCHTIDRLWEAIPDMLRYCSSIGGYHSLTDGILKGDNFISFAGIRWHRKTWPESLEYNDVILPQETKGQV